ncbi:MAG: lysophospholipid acyltransferase family protein, partial [Bacteroidia bacterium]
NLENSFPDKSKQEILKIEREFYSHFFDLIVESIRLFSIGEKELTERNKMLNPEVMNALFDEGKSVILTGGHFNNWETGAAILGAQLKHLVIGIYAPLSNPFFNSKILKSRERFGMEMLSKKIVKAGFEKNKDQLTATIFATDQSPTHSKSVHWTTFLNQPTAVLLGSEIYAKEYNYPVVFIYVTKVKRGYYEIEAKVLEKNPAETKDGELTEKHTRWLEAQIRETPQYWLWTHKRWKRKLKEGDEFYKPKR